MTQSLQILQLSLFGVSILVLLALGAVILLNSVSVVNRRWYLAVFLPLLLASPAAFFSEDTVSSDWRTWLVAVAGVAVVVVLVVVMRGYLVYGLGVDAVESALVRFIQADGGSVKSSFAERHSFWGSGRPARVLSIVQKSQQGFIWLTSRFNEVLIQADSAEATALLRQALPALRQVDQDESDFSSRATGFLYCVVALVFAVMSWIFFFEPRLVLLP